MKKSLVGRKSILRSLPPLAEAAESFKGFAEGEHRSERIFEILAGIIQRSRRATAHPFYSMRKVAAFFGVSLTTVATVYRRLEQEGVLTRIRSSQTMIPARAPRTRFAVRGIVAMPIWLPGFLQFMDWRQWFAIVEEEFSRHRFVAEPIFFKGGLEANPNFTDRVLQFNPDYILWFCPAKWDANSILSFKDAGVPLITISNPRDTFPTRAYPISYEKAFARGIKEWQQSGNVDHIAVAMGNLELSDLELMPALQNSSLPYHVEALPVFRPSALPAYLARLTSHPRSGIIFRNDLTYVLLCSYMPEAMMEIIRRHRVIVQRRVTIPATLKNQTSDGVFFSWTHLARKIANDLDQGKGTIPAVQPVFHASWCPRMPVAEIFQSYPNE